MWHQQHTAPCQKQSPTLMLDVARKGRCCDMALAFIFTSLCIPLSSSLLQRQATSHVQVAFMTTNMCGKSQRLWCSTHYMTLVQTSSIQQIAAKYNVCHIMQQCWAADGDTGIAIFSSQDCLTGGCQVDLVTKLTPSSTIICADAASQHCSSQQFLNLSRIRVQH